MKHESWDRKGSPAVRVPTQRPQKSGCETEARMQTRITSAIDRQVAPKQAGVRGNPNQTNTGKERQSRLPLLLTL